MPLRLALYEPEADGHHMALYTRNILREALNRGWEVTLVTTERAMSHAGYELVRKEFEGRIDVEIMEDRQTPADAGDFQRLKDQFARLLNYRKAHKDLISRRPIDVAFMVNLDQADLPMAFLGSPFGRTPFLGVLIGRQFHCPKVGVNMDPLKRRDKLFEPFVKRVLKLRKLKFMLVVDETMEKWAKQDQPPYGEKIRHVPDPAGFTGLVDREAARKELGLPETAFVALLYGALSERKGVADLIGALQSPDCPENVVGLFAGRQDEFANRAISAAVESSPSRFIELNKFLNDEDEARVLSACDVVWLGYKHWFGSSGVMYQACAAGKPVLSMDKGLVGWAVAEYGIGIPCATEEPGIAAAALKELASDPAQYSKYAQAGLKVALDHTPQRFATAVCNHIQSAAQ